MHSGYQVQDRQPNSSPLSENEKRPFQTYVANRVEEIRGNSKPDEWNHVPGYLNPAHDVLWGLNLSELSLNHRWLRGPEFLGKPESPWPNADLKEVPDRSSHQSCRYKYHLPHFKGKCCPTEFGDCNSQGGYRSDTQQLL